MITLTQQNSEKTINLGNVSIITLEEQKCKVIFNFMNPINKFGRKTPDYAYLVYNTAEQAKESFEKILQIPLITQGFLVSENPDNLSVVCKEAINTISVREEKELIIFNLNFPVQGEGNTEISKSVFWSYASTDTFESDKLTIQAAPENQYYV